MCLYQLYGAINMTQRITNADLEQMLNIINKDMPNGYYLVVGQRYGYKAVDLMQGDSTSVIKTMISGVRSGEVFMWLNAYHYGMLMASGRY